jgi:hypothetical protein
LEWPGFQAGIVNYPKGIEAIAIRIATNTSNTAIDFLLMKSHSPFLIDSF